MIDLSVIIPARNEPYLQKTIDSLLDSAGGDIEIIVVLDGWWPDPIIKDDQRVILIHNSKSEGMRPSINAAARIAKGKYLMKCDAHCCFDKDFDIKLAKSCKYKWTIIPRRYKLDVDKWERTGKPKDFQYIRQSDLKGQDWPEYAQRKPCCKGAVDLMTTQGSCWFIHRKRFFDLSGLDEINYGAMGKEAQEICLKTWLSGGRFMLNRNTWYAHWNKNTGLYRDVKKEKQKSADYVLSFWKGNHGYKHDLQWLVDRFAPVPTWEKNMKQVNEEYPEHKLIKETSNRIVNVIKKEGMNRAKLYKYFASLGFKIGAEIGVQRGRNAWIMFQNIPDLKLFLIDPYVDNFDTQRRWGEKIHNKAYRIAHNRLGDFNVEFIKNYSLEASLEIENNSLDFVYIDGDHSYDYAMMDIQIWSRKVKKGGIVSGHDYHFVKSNKFKVEDAVNDFARAHNIMIYITDEKAKELPGDGYASWYWIKK